MAILNVLRALEAADRAIAGQGQQVRAVQLDELQQQIRDDFLFVVSQRQERPAMLRDQIGRELGQVDGLDLGEGQDGVRQQQPAHGGSFERFHVVVGSYAFAGNPQPGKKISIYNKVGEQIAVKYSAT